MLPESTTVWEACFYHGILRAAQLEMEIAHAVVCKVFLFPDREIYMRSCSSLQDARGCKAGAVEFEADTLLSDVKRHAAHVSIGEAFVRAATHSRDGKTADVRVASAVAQIVRDSRLQGLVEHGHHNSILVPRVQNLSANRKVEEDFREQFPGILKHLAIPQLPGPQALAWLPSQVATLTAHALTRIKGVLGGYQRDAELKGERERGIVAEAHLCGIEAYRPEKGQHARTILTSADPRALAGEFSLDPHHRDRRGP